MCVGYDVGLLNKCTTHDTRDFTLVIVCVLNKNEAKELMDAPSSMISYD